MNDQERLKLILKEQRKYITENRIEFFGNYNKELDEKFPDMRLKGANPLQAQLIDAWDDLSLKVFTFCGANRIGKTTILTIIGESVMFGEWLWNGKKIHFGHNMPRKVRYVGQDWEEHIKTVVEPELKKWWPKNRKVSTKKNNQGINATWIDEKTGSELVIMSNKQDPGTHEGWSGDLILYDEPPKRDIRVANARGLVDRKGREVFGMTLLKEAWVDREVIKAKDEKGRPEKTYFHVNGDISTNVGFGIDQEGVDQFAKTLKPNEKEARLQGKPAYLSGLIFPRFDYQMHVRDRFKIPLDWIVDIAIDWHPSKGWAILFVATDSINRKWVIDEIFEKNNYKYIGEEIVRRIRKYDYRVENDVLIDPLARSGSQSDIEEETVFDKLGDILYQYEIGLSNASKDQNSGIDLINEYLINESEEPALFVFRDCTIAIQHMEDWMWKDGKPDAEGEDMCENLYRIMLLDTQYYEPIIRHKRRKPTNWTVV